MFQQDSAPSHKAIVTQDWLSENFHDHVTPNMWPPNSPDLNPAASATATLKTSQRFQETGRTKKKEINNK